MGGIKVIVFDFWGTVMENGVYSPVRQVQRRLDIFRVPFPEYIQKFEDVFMTKKYESLKDGFTEVCKAFDVEPNDEMIERLIGMWNKNTLLAKPFYETDRVLEKLKKNYKLVLAINTDCFSAMQVIEKFEIDKKFDLIMQSCDVGILKTDPKMFEEIMKKMKIKDKEKIVMVGDSIESDIKSAEKAGIKAILVDRRNRREGDYSPRIRNLQEIFDVLDELNA